MKELLESSAVGIEVVIQSKPKKPVCNILGFVLLSDLLALKSLD